MSDNLYLFANNNNGQAENNGSYRLYDMKIEGDSEGVESGVDYVDYLEGDGASYIDTKTVLQNGYSVEVDYMIKSDALNNTIMIYGAGSPTGYAYDNQGGYGLGVEKTYSYIQTRDAGSGIFVNSYTKTKITQNTKNNFKYTFTNISSQRNPYLFANNYGNTADNISCKGLLIYSFKAYDTSDNLVLDLRPCLNTEGVPCMYDEVSKRYLYNQGTGTFRYKKKLRDFQPVLDSNNVPCLLDKIKNKFYYSKSGEIFKTKEKVNGYRKLAYLQGDEASWINTNFTVQDIIGYDMEIKCENPSNDAVIFGFAGTDISNSNKLVGLLYRKSLGWHIYGSCESYTHNDLLFTLTNFSNSILDKQIITLFGNGGIYTGDSKIYYAKLFDENDNLVFHAIPVLDQDNVPCMYDKVSDTFFYNQGTGEFSYGIEELDASDENYTPIEYIESTGTQYIDTEVVPTSNTDIEMTCRVCDYNETPTLTNSYIMNGLQINNNTYQYNSIDTTVQPNLVASTGATLTMGSTNLALLDEDDIETATNNGWSLV